MRFLTLTTIAVAVIASVSALPVDSIRDVGQNRKDIPLSKRTEQLVPSAETATPAGGNGGVGAAPPADGNGQDDFAGGTTGDAVNTHANPSQEPGALSKRAEALSGGVADGNGQDRDSADNNTPPEGDNAGYEPEAGM